MGVERKYERDIDLLLAEEFSVSQSFAAWFLEQTKGFKGINAKVVDVYVSKSDVMGESDLVVIYEKLGGESRFALHIEDKINAPLQPEQEARYRRRAAVAIRRGDYSEFEVILCSPAAYRLVHPEVVTFDALVSYEAISEFLQSQGADDPRSQYRSNFIATSARRNSNAYTRVDDAVTNCFWKKAFDIAARDYPDLEMKPLTVTKDSTWLNFRPLDMPTQPRRIYISFKGDRGFMDLTFTACLARLFLPQVKNILDPRMTIHQTGKSAAIRINVEPFKICEPDDDVLAKVRAAFAGCVWLITFFRQHRETLVKAAGASLSDED